MPMLTIRHDLRAPSFGPSSSAEMYAASLEQFRWADDHGWDFLVLSEHHGIDDGWMPAPLTMAGVVLGATRRAPVLVSAAIVPLHDPVRLAEQIAVLDNAAPGRLWVVAGAGYREEEFEMAGVERSRRGRILEEHLRAMLAAWTGEPFEWEGRRVRVTPLPATRPHPTVLVGGGVEAAARRAARLGLPFLPMNDDPRYPEWYADEAARHGHEGGFVLTPTGPTFVHCTRDPERAWAQIGEYLLYETQTYASYNTSGPESLPTVHAETVDDLRASPQIVVATPDEIVALAEGLPPGAALTFQPMAGGLPPDLAWESLELFASEALPRIRPG